MSASLPGEAGGAGDRRPARVVTVAADAEPTSVLRDLALEPGQPVLVVFGGADSLAGSVPDERVVEIGRAIARAAANTRAVVVDGGTDSGMMAAVGRAVAEDGHRVPLVGVAPDAAVTADGVRLEQNHSHLALVEGGTWGDEMPMLVKLAGALAGPHPVAVVVGGGDLTTREAAEAIRRGWRVYAVEGTGGTADALVARSRRKPSGEGPVTASLAAAPPGPAGPAPAPGVWRLSVSDPGEITRRLGQSLRTSPGLEHVWTQFGRYDAAAKRLQTRFRREQGAVLVLGIAATFFALLHNAIGSDGWWDWARAPLRWTVVALPIGVSMAIVFAEKVQAGKRWVLLRGAAEATKREIFHYRTGTGVYAADRLTDGRTPEAALLERAQAIAQTVRKTEVSSASLPDYTDPLPPTDTVSKGDDGMTPLDAERYLDVRIRDQLGFYRGRTRKLERKLRLLQFLTVTAGGVGTLVAAAGAELWVGLTTAIGGAAVAYLAYLQVESTLVAYNQAIGSLEDVESSAVLRLDTGTVDDVFATLVERAEAAIASEHGSWTHQMQEALTKLAAKSEPGTG